MNSKDITNNKKEELDLINSKNKLGKLKSDFFIQKFFNYMPKKAILKTIKYNKNIQKRLNINIINYKTFSEIYSSIEIEIIPKKNEYGPFININEEDAKYYHIYFDNKKEKEIKETKLNKKIKFQQ